MKHSFTAFVAAAAVSGGSFFLALAPASAGGFIGDIVKGIYPPATLLVDSVDDYLRNGGTMRPNPNIGAPPPPPSSPMPYCVTPYGTFGPDPVLNVPAGTPCWHAFPNGQVVNGQVAWGG